jgi:rRNA-processing protein EBP2
MAKKGATQSLNAEPKAKQSVTDRKSKEGKGDQKKGKKSISGGKVDDEEQWEDEDSEDDKKVAPKSNGSKIDNRQHGDEESSHEDGESEDSEDDEDQGGIDIAGIDDSDSESELGSDGDGDREDKDDAEEEEEEEEIDVDELISDLDEEDEENIAAGTRTRQTIYNKEGLLAALRRFALDTNPKTVPFAFHQSVVSSKRTEESIPSVEDDLQRELAFVNQSLEAARQARTLLRKEGVPFTRPTDYFAETVRSDATMEKVKAKLIEEATAKKAAAEARKQRDLKKFGKQVQVQKQQERAKQKREALDKINLLKRSTLSHLIYLSCFMVRLMASVLTCATHRTSRRRVFRPGHS